MSKKYGIIKTEVIIEADYNDADYVTQISTLDTEQENKLRKIISKLGGEHDVDTIAEILTKEEFDWLYDYCPSGPDGNDIHTIYSITIKKIVEEEQLL